MSTLAPSGREGRAMLAEASDMEVPTIVSYTQHIVEPTTADNHTPMHKELSPGRVQR